MFQARNEYKCPVELHRTDSCSTESSFSNSVALPQSAWLRRRGRLGAHVRRNFIAVFVQRFAGTKLLFKETSSVLVVLDTEAKILPADVYNSTPQVFLIDKGRIIRRVPGPSETLEEFLSKAGEIF